MVLITISTKREIEMELLLRITLFICGIINLLPVTIAFLPEKIALSYGVKVSDNNMELLLRHRAVLFGIVSLVLIHAAFTKSNYILATIIGLISMLSFVLLYYHIGEINKELKTIMVIDFISSFFLLVVFILYKIWQSK